MPRNFLVAYVLSELLAATPPIEPTEESREKAQEARKAGATLGVEKAGLPPEDARLHISYAGTLLVCSESAASIGIIAICEALQSLISSLFPTDHKTARMNRRYGGFAVVRMMIELPEGVLAALRKDPKSFAEEMRLAAAVKWYELGLVSQGRAAEIAGLPRRQFIDALSRLSVSPFQYTADEVLREAGDE